MSLLLIIFLSILNFVLTDTASAIDQLFVHCTTVGFVK